MSNQEILEAAVQKAIDNGWEAKPLGGHELWERMPQQDRHDAIHLMIATGKNTQSEGYRNIIFNHDFAKALWGEGQAIHKKIWVKPHPYSYLHPNDRQTPGHWRNQIVKNLADGSHSWQYHLQQMVVADDPIAYLGEHLGR